MHTTKKILHYEKMPFGDLPATIQQCNFLDVVAFFGWPVGYISSDNEYTVAIFKIKPNFHAHNIPR